MTWFLLNLALCLFGIAVFFGKDLFESLKSMVKPWKSLPAGYTAVRVGAAVYIICSITMAILSKSICLGAAAGTIPAVTAHSVFKMAQGAIEKRETGQITNFLTGMAKWSCVKNDLVYCLDKTCKNGLKGPLGKITENALIRIYSGMDVVAALGLMEKEAASADMRYIARNIGFAAEKGGNLKKLFKGMEEQFFMLEEEYFKRKISTFRDRGAAYLMMAMVLAAAIWFVGGNPVAREFYIGTPEGRILILVFSLVFGAAVLTSPGGGL
jgi:Flp pilus assembly protein TadB